jgi:hypothetical protein
LKEETMLDMLNKLICVSLNIHIWSGRKKLQPADLNLKPGEIPPEELASLGVKKICDPDELKTFQNLRRRAERACEASGVRFLGGYTIPQDKAEAVVDELRKVASDFAEEKQHFLARYSESTEVWLKTIPSQWRHMVAEAIEPIESIASRLSFSHQTFQVQGVEGLDDGLTASVNTLGDRLIKEISRSAIQTWEASFRGRAKVSQKALRPIRAILEKAKGLSFLEGSLVPVIAGIEEELKGLPRSGYLEGRDFRQLVGVLHTLVDLEGAKNPVVIEQEDADEDIERKIEPFLEREGMTPKSSATPMPATWF